MDIGNSAKMSLLYDYYGSLLTEKQNEIFKLYHDDNLSLSEIGEQMSISKQGIHDSLKKAESLLLGFEEKLCLIRDSHNNKKIVKDIKSDIEKINIEEKTDPETRLFLENIKKQIEKFNL